MRVVDTGVLVAAASCWHEAHLVAHRELVARPAVTANTLVEAFSVLTRLPGPHRIDRHLAARFLDEACTQEPLTLTARDVRHLITRRLPALGITGGAIYDAFIAETTRLAGAVLVTLDRRAAGTYARIGCEFDLLAP